MAMRLTLLLALIAVADAQRALHYVIRTSDLKATLEFTEQVLGMMVLRHEENEGACPITCNGKFDSAWSKTMVGFHPEDEGFALEITYNYAVSSYTPSIGFQRFALAVFGGASMISQRAKDLGYAVEERTDSSLITGPDGYVYQLLLHPQSGYNPSSAMASWRGDGIVLSAVDPDALARWYTEVLGMVATPMESTVLPVPGAKGAPHSKGTIELYYDTSEIEPGMLPRLLIEPAPDGVTPLPGAWDGRNAFSMPEAKVREVHTKLLAESPDLIVHELQEIEEKLGKLVILILKDPQGYEICLVSSETFYPTVREATDYMEPNWKARRAIAEKLAAPEAADDILKTEL